MVNNLILKECNGAQIVQLVSVIQEDDVDDFVVQ